MTVTDQTLVDLHSFSSFSFDEFYQENYQRVLRYLVRRCASNADAEDLAGQIFLYCYKNWANYDPSKAALSSWLFLIVRSRFKNYCRDRRDLEDVDKFAEILSTGDPFEQAIHLDALRQQVAQALSQLPDNQRKAIIYRFFGEYSDAQIALQLRTSQGNVRVLIFRGLRKMKEYLQKLDKGE